MNVKKCFLFFLIFLFTSSLAEGKISVIVDNKPVSFDVEPFILNDTTYVPVRFISNSLNANKVSFDESTKTVIIEKDNSVINLIINKNYAYINNTYTKLTHAPLLKNGRTFVPLRFVSENLNAQVSWNQNTYTVTITSNTSKKITSSTGASPSTKNTVTATSRSQTTTTRTSIYSDEVYWLSRIIEAEAGGEPYIGKVAVGEVILNRVQNENFPNTIWTVIFDEKFGTQFEPVSNGTIYNTPSSDSILAAKEALSGSNYIGNCLYFLNPQIAKSTWITNNRTFYSTIGKHDFYI